LAQLVCEKIKNQDLELDQVKVYIQKSAQFEVNKKKVSLKRKLSTTATSSSSKDKKNTTVEKARKKSKSNHSSTSSLGNSQSTKDKKNVGPVASISTWRDDRKIVLVGNDAQASAQLNNDPDFFPFSSFDDDDDRCKNAIHSALLKHCTVGHGFQRPSPIQAQAWPILAKGYDVIGIAETGSGKTLAFSLPALTWLSNQTKSHRTLSSSSSSPRMLVLAPTRESAMQSDAVLQEFGALVGLQSLAVYGGVPKYQQTSVLKGGGVDCLVATPGRLKDLIQEKQSCSLDQVEFLVLDEADRMLDMGFEQDVRFIISQCPTQGSKGPRLVVLPVQEGGGTHGTDAAARWLEVQFDSR
jgi:ATP-dependent RNA helicase DBP3